MMVFHGSNQEVKEPRLVEPTRGLDFGAGFYLTTSGQQAARFSKIVARRKSNGSPTVNIYEFDMETAEKSLSVRRFAKADRDWLAFVSHNRMKTYSGDAYDVVVGPVANDTVMPTIQAYLAGFLTEEATLVTLKASKLEDQITLKTDKALSLVRFIRSYHSGVGDGKNG